jgi:hypothetical protein
MQGVISIVCICWGLICALRYVLLCRMFHGLLRRMYIVLLLDETFCRHQLGPFDLWCHLLLGFLVDFFVWMTYVLVTGILKSSTTNALESLYAFNSFSVCLMKVDAQTLDAHMLTIVISFWYIAPFISLKCLCLVWPM